MAKVEGWPKAQIKAKTLELKINFDYVHVSEWKRYEGNGSKLFLSLLFSKKIFS